MSEKVRILVLMQVRTPQVHPKSLFGVILGHFGPRNPKKRTCFCPTFTFLVNFMSNFGSKVSQKVIISTFFASNMGWDPSGPSQITFLGHFGPRNPKKRTPFCPTFTFLVQILASEASKSDHFYHFKASKAFKRDQLIPQAFKSDHLDHFKASKGHKFSPKIA